MDLGLASIIVVLIATPAIAYTTWRLFFWLDASEEQPSVPSYRPPVILPSEGRRVNSQDKYRGEYVAMGFRVVDLESTEPPTSPALKKTYAPPTLTKYTRPARSQPSAAPAAKQVEALPRRRTRRNL